MFGERCSALGTGWNVVINTLKIVEKVLHNTQKCSELTLLAQTKLRWPALLNKFIHNRPTFQYLMLSSTNAQYLLL